MIDFCPENGTCCGSAGLGCVVFGPAFRALVSAARTLLTGLLRYFYGTDEGISIGVRALLTPGALARSYIEFVSLTCLRTRRYASFSFDCHRCRFGILFRLN